MHRPRLGLALGGGVARGWAHIGVLKTLMRAGIEPDILCGTSIGAVVGACYLADRLDVLERWARRLNKMRLVGYLDFRVRQPGLIGGDRIAKELHESLGGRLIEELPHPFSCVATDLLTGHEVWLNQGLLVDAVRASFALPGVFPPVQIGHQLLVDGALVNPVPVSVCRSMGAHMVIAVSLTGDIIGGARNPGDMYPTVAGFDLLDVMEQQGSGWTGGLNTMVRRVFRRERDTPSMFGVMASSLGIILDRITRSRLAGEPPDVHIVPRLGHIGIAEFQRADEMIDAGIEAAEQALPDIRDAMSILGIPANDPKVKSLPPKTSAGDAAD